jgi:transposase InsO family protein
MSKLGDVWEFKPVRASGSNDPADRSKAQNAALESFFSSLKIERIRGRVYRSRDEARADMFDYIERFHNPKRRHSTLGYLSPVDFEKQAMQA